MPVDHRVGCGFQRAAQRDPHQPGGAEQAGSQARLLISKGTHNKDQRNFGALYTGGECENCKQYCVSFFPSCLREVINIW